MLASEKSNAVTGWVVTGTGPLVMLLSAIAIMSVTAYLYVLGALHFNDYRLQHSSALLRDGTNLLGMLGAVGGVIIYFSMWFYWAQIDRSRRNTKRFWFFVLLLGLWYGSCLYYFLIYRPQVNAAQKELNT